MSPTDPRLLFILFVVFAPVPARAVDPTVLATFAGMGIRVSTMEFVIDLDDLNMRQDMLITVATARSMKSVEGLKVALKQTDITELPTEVVLLNLVVPERGSCTLAIRADNFYLLAYTNDRLEWQAFLGREHLVPTSTPLPFTSEYNERGMGPRTGLAALQLSRAAVIAAVNTLLSSRRGDTGDQGPLKRALATITLVFCEGSRFRFVRDRVRAGWETGSQITKDEALRVTLWAKISCALAKGWTGGATARLAERGGFPNTLEGAKSFLLVLVYGTKCLSVMDALPVT